MNKKVIFIPLILLAIQPNKILSGAQKEIKAYLGSGAWLTDQAKPFLEGSVLYSADPAVQKLLRSCQINMEALGDKGTSLYPSRCIAIIKKHYPNANIVETGAFYPMY